MGRTALALLLGTALTMAPVSTAAAPPADDELALSTPVEDPYYPGKGDPGVDVLRYALDLTWKPKNEVLRGVATIDLRVTADDRTLTLDLARSLAVRTVLLDGTPVTASREGNHVVVDAGRVLPAQSRHELRIAYRGTPRPTRGPATRDDVQSLGWHTRRNGEAWTMQEPFGAFTWYPVNDHPSDKAYYEATISTPERMTGVFNGKLLSKQRVDGRRLTSWRLDSPAASYLVTIAIGDYVRVTDRGPRGLPVAYWLPRGHSDKLLRRVRQLPGQLRWLEGRLGRYPFDRAGVVAVPGGSAMETQTLVTMSRHLLEAGGKRAREVLLHELAHQWYGDTAGPDNWKDLWLNEAFTMYAQILYDVEVQGASMRRWRNDLAGLDQVLRDDNGPPGEYKKGQFGSHSVYYSGALMVDQLRTKVGEAAFAELWRAWPGRHRFTANDRDDYIRWASARTGVDLEPFITEWLTSPVTPELL